MRTLPVLLASLSALLVGSVTAQLSDVPDADAVQAPEDTHHPAAAPATPPSETAAVPAASAGSPTAASPPASPAPAEAAVPTEAAPALSLATTAFLDQGILPVLYTCDGKNVSPQFAWTNLPKNTRALAMVVSDPEAPQGTWYHWVIYNLPTDVTELPENVTELPKGTLTGNNSWGNTKYEGPCPPKGTVHSYLFTLYALDQPLTLSAGATGEAVLAAMKSHIVGSVTETAVYSRWRK